MKRIIVTVLTAIVGLFGYTIVDTAVESRVSDLEDRVAYLESVVEEYHSEDEQIITTTKRRESTTRKRFTTRPATTKSVSEMQSELDAAITVTRKPTTNYIEDNQTTKANDEGTTDTTDFTQNWVTAPTTTEFTTSVSGEIGDVIGGIIGDNGNVGGVEFSNGYIVT